MSEQKRYSILFDTNTDDPIDLGDSWMKLQSDLENRKLYDSRWHPLPACPIEQIAAHIDRPSVSASAVCSLASKKCVAGSRIRPNSVAASKLPPCVAVTSLLLTSDIPFTPPLSATATSLLLTNDTPFIPPTSAIRVSVTSLLFTHDTSFISTTSATYVSSPISSRPSTSFFTHPTITDSITSADSSRSPHIFQIEGVSADTPLTAIPLHSHCTLHTDHLHAETSSDIQPSPSPVTSTRETLTLPTSLETTPLHAPSVTQHTTVYLQESSTIEFNTLSAVSEAVIIASQTTPSYKNPDFDFNYQMICTVAESGFPYTVKGKITTETNKSQTFTAVEALEPFYLPNTTDTSD